MYEAVHAHPDGEATAARHAATAAEYGFGGVVVRTREAAGDADAIAETYGVDVVPGIEVVADGPSRASGAVGNFRTDCVVLLVRGGSPGLNRFAVEQERVDVLTRPFAGDGDIDDVMVRAAADNGVRLEFDLGPVLRSTGGSRVRHLRHLRKLRELVAHHDAPFVVSANPASHLELRAPRELIAVGEQVGFDADAIERGLREWGVIAERNRERLADEFIEPGVRLGRATEDAGGGHSAADSESTPTGEDDEP